MLTHHRHARLDIALWWEDHQVIPVYEALQVLLDHM
jgi:hypothetical protein